MIELIVSITVEFASGQADKKRISNFLKMQSITLCFRQYQPESVYVLPKTSKARIVEIYSPEEYKKMPKKMQWEELRRYWRRVYGYLLSPNPEEWLPK